MLTSQTITDSSAEETAETEDSRGAVAHQTPFPSGSSPLPAAGYLWAEMGLIATALMWGLNIPIVKEATHRMDPFVFNAARLTMSTIALGFLAALEWRQRVRTEQQKIGLEFSKQPGELAAGAVPWVRFGIFSLLTGFLYMIFFMLGVSRTTAGNVALLLSSMPMWTAVLGVWFFGERLRSANWIGLTMTFVGTVTVITLGANSGGGGLNLSSEFLIGNLMMLCAALTWASGTLISKKLLESMGAMQLAFLCALVTTPLHLMIVAPQIGTWMPVMLQPAMAAKIIFSGVFSTGVAYSFWHIGVRKLGGAHAAVFQNLVTLVALLASWWFLGERITFAQILGGLTILVGLLIMRRGR